MGVLSDRHAVIGSFRLGFFVEHKFMSRKARFVLDWRLQKNRKALVNVHEEKSTFIFVKRSHMIRCGQKGYGERRRFASSESFYNKMRSVLIQFTP